MNDKPTDWTTDDWATPPEVVERLAAELGPFDLDPCAKPETAKALRYYTKGDDGLKQPWHGRVWLNPPYSDPRPWVQRAAEAVANGECERVVALLPAAVDTHWFHDYVLDAGARVRFVRGRIKFIGWKGTPIGSPKAGNIIAIYEKRESLGWPARKS